MGDLECSGLAFHKRGRLVVRALLEMINFRLVFAWSFLVPSFLVLLLWIGFEFHQRDFFRCTYCMHMHEVSIMDA